MNKLILFAIVVIGCLPILSGCAGSTGSVIGHLDGAGVIADAEHALELTPDSDIALEGCLTQVIAGAKFIERAKMGPQGPFTTLAVTRTIRREADIELCLSLVRGPVTRFLGGL